LESLESEKDFAKTAREKNFLRAELQKANHECFEKGENLSGVYAEKKTLQAELRRTVTKASENEKAWLEQVAETSKLEDQLKTQNSTIDRHVNTIQALQSKMNVLNNEALVRDANNPKIASLQSQNAGLEDRNVQQQKALAEMTERLNEAELTAKEAVTDLLVCNDDLEAQTHKTAAFQDACDGLSPGRTAEFDNHIRLKDQQVEMLEAELKECSDNLQFEKLERAQDARKVDVQHEALLERALNAEREVRMLEARLGEYQGQNEQLVQKMEKKRLCRNEIDQAFDAHHRLILQEHQELKIQVAQRIRDKAEEPQTDTQIKDLKLKIIDFETQAIKQLTRLQEAEQHAETSARQRKIDKETYDLDLDIVRNMRESELIPGFRRNMRDQLLLTRDKKIADFKALVEQLFHRVIRLSLNIIALGGQPTDDGLKEISDKARELAGLDEQEIVKAVYAEEGSEDGGGEAAPEGGDEVAEDGVDDG